MDKCRKVSHWDELEPCTLCAKTLRDAAPALLTQLKESVRWVAKLAADNDEEGNVIGLRAKQQVDKIDVLLKEIEG